MESQYKRQKCQETKCKHMANLLCGGNTVCKAGIDVKKLTGGEKFGWLKRIPCNTVHESDIKCDKFQTKTQEDLDLEEKEWEKLLKTSQVIRPLAGKLKTEHKNGGSGVEECPICKNDLSWRIASYNGHIAMKCKTENCITMME